NSKLNSSKDIIVAILRIVNLVHFSDTPDYTWDAYSTYYWAIVEVGLGTTVACAPTLRYFVSTLVSMFKKGLSSFLGGYGRKIRRDPQQYSEISNGEIALHPYAGYDISAAGSKDSTPFVIGTSTAAAGGIKSTDSHLQHQISDTEGIRVQKDFSIQRDSKPSASARPAPSQ
ncbi:MAG: hypothetical protein Q9179_007676, partial [Wetmoreana sp. 5 TL-2023]